MKREADGSYLWDRSGEPDDVVQDLESRLTPFRFEGLWISARDGIMRTAHGRYEEDPASAPEGKRN